MKIAVLFGGDSAERDVSIASGAQVARGLIDAGHEVICVDTFRGVLTRAETESLFQKQVAEIPPDTSDMKIFSRDLAGIFQHREMQDIDVIFLALHGGSGEDGTIQAFLDMTGKPYTGSGHLGSAVAMDKDMSKRLMKENGIPTPDWLMTPVCQAMVHETLGYPVVVKPNALGSTIGLTVVRKPEELKSALKLAGKYDDEVMIEKYIEGRELTVGILADQPLGVGEIVPVKGDIFDYESKYQKGGATEIFPADLTSSGTAEIQNLALMVHRVLKLNGYSRVDFRMDTQGGFWCLEANTLPGMTQTSLLPQSARVAGIGFSELCERICSLALKKGGDHE